MFDSHVEYLGCRCFPVEGLSQRALAIQNGIKVQLEPRNDIASSTTGTSSLFKILFLTLSSKLRNLIALLLPGFPSGVALFPKTFLLVYKSFNAMIPLYLWELLAYRKSSFSLRSTCNNDLNEPSSRTRTYGNRSFAVSASRMWNLLPPFIRRSSSIPFLKETLKTGLFEKFLKEHFKTFFLPLLWSATDNFLWVVRSRSTPLLLLISLLSQVRQLSETSTFAYSQRDFFRRCILYFNLMFSKKGGTSFLFSADNNFWKIFNAVRGTLCNLVQSSILHARSVPPYPEEAGETSSGETLVNVNLSPSVSPQVHELLHYVFPYLW